LGSDAPELPPLDAPLALDATAVGFLDAWYGFAASVLEQLRVDAAGHEPSMVQLWPEHFDIAIEAGHEAEGRRAGYGCSPGDAAHDAPYVYVSAWQPVDRADAFWNDRTFNGASLSLGDLATAEDQRARALSFFHEGFARLTSGGPR
jgi:hypothetical protein